MQAHITREPWLDHYEVRLVSHAGRLIHAAVGVDERGQIIWAAVDEGARIEPLLVLREEALQALARAAGDITQASDQTVEALNDTRTVRDRLLTLVEAAITKGVHGE